MGNPKRVLRRPWLAAGTAIIAGAGPAADYGLLQHLAHGPVQPQHLFRREAVCPPEGMDASGKERLIGVHIAYPGEEGLIA